MNDSLKTASIAAEQEGRRFDQVLAELFPDYSRSRLQSWVRDGRILLDGATVQPRFKVKAGQQVELSPEIIEKGAEAAEPIPLQVVFEDDDLIVINKPVGLVVHPGAGNPAGTLMNGLLHYAPELQALPRAGILHRLDKDTSGLLLIARSLTAHTRLVRDLEARLIKREYRAICNDRLTAGETVEAPIGRHRTHRTRMAVTDGGRSAVTHYRVLARFAAHSFIAVRLETGRTHQIRVHLAWRHHALIGDPVYGGRLKIPQGASKELTDSLKGFRRQALHASDLGFEHPVAGTTMQFHAPLPEDLLGLLHVLGGGTATDYEAMLWP
ncbi:MAG: 23S rRNA pseudouridine(1911/1915/1917) synthase RluD [Gammaproteobacteria bacterium]|nr:23S rRNA pseudouridine(1911/1915/1917) synthase RluD [Gammaproteobacteria bacterium]MCP4088631.1 23S rRNA pseudouridine(1911/1915/1917) synthase RluD [Gammaproteobacteria bacterium]MCP4276461.1 23S rRNA pseudouridine(1911/1915/1917) synthase RluD [Gammaproteobacteria bacterium]MCP4832338.1 23S rRNA pseudouridine(1911/1915/1917) synthase RluD [Gammaproteobacteria bacterium]MCP4929148.1 23S rRNA pseudouridine(1911/1915/1917) synthase RluD [Gammaproteobacteria bacterium]